MRQDIDMRTILNEAAKSGLLLGLFTGVFIYVAMLIGMINSDSFGAKLMITAVDAQVSGLPVASEILHAQVRRGKSDAYATFVIQVRNVYGIVLRHHRGRHRTCQHHIDRARKHAERN